MSVVIQPATFSFLKALAKNNNREWFNARKQTYLDAYQNLLHFVDALMIEMNKHDELEQASAKQSMYRVYSDVRFKKDKSPYNPRLAFSFQRATKLKRGGYYVNIKPGNSYLACGFFGPNPTDLLRIRTDINYNYADWQKLLKSKSIKQNFGTLSGEKVLTTPRGFDKEHAGIELLRHKQFILRHPFTDEEVLAKNFLSQVNTLFKSARPWLNYMSEVLTTDLNGELIA
ncbi:MAG: DUF2461 domain-containing protein [Chitinophagales bacterium]